MSAEATQLFGAGTVLLSGYLFVRFSPYRKFCAEHLRTDRYALLVAGWSLVLYVIGGIMAELLPDWTPACLTWVTHVRTALSNVGIDAAAVNAIAISLPLSLIDSLVILWRMRNDEAMDTEHESKLLPRLRLAAVARFVRKSHDQTVRTLFRASMLRKRVMVTLKSHKVYVGEPFLPDLDPSHDLTSIRLIPFASGYRDKDTKRVTLATQYSHIGARLFPLNEEKSGDEPDPADPLATDLLGIKMAGAVSRTIDINDLGIVIARSEIETMMIWDATIYTAFQDPPSVAEPAASAAPPADP